MVEAALLFHWQAVECPAKAIPPAPSEASDASSRVVEEGVVAMEGAAVEGAAVEVEAVEEEMEEEVPVEVMPVIGVVEEYAETGAMLYTAMLVFPQF